MPNPKRRHSRGRTGRRRAHHRLTAKGACICPHCSAVMVPHRVCMACGYYRGREVIEIDAE